MSRYIDGFVLPIPEKNLARYRRIARVAGKVWRDHRGSSTLTAGT